MVTMLDVAAIATTWEASGSPSCSHERVEDEYYGDAPTGDVACLSCGDAWPKDAAKPGERRG